MKTPSRKGARKTKKIVSTRPKLYNFFTTEPIDPYMAPTKLLKKNPDKRVLFTSNAINSSLSNIPYIINSRPAQKPNTVVTELYTIKILFIGKYKQHITIQNL